eukprot:TRINITY_DN104741_c0_g1_i1.p2 TRINITY_DN104741_c0_g1~~TRINITY_DN104741_c0_g1_i1.p2  ORF type:complete len:131 (-),score=0.09 TRINITY_DN104741_c0_g1_i1:97-489(-)
MYHLGYVKKRVFFFAIYMQAYKTFVANYQVEEEVIDIAYKVDLITFDKSYCQVDVQRPRSIQIYYRRMNGDCGNENYFNNSREHWVNQNGQIVGSSHKTVCWEQQYIRTIVSSCRKLNPNVSLLGYTVLS